MRIAEHSKCTGCGACANVCSKRCINLQKDKYGFYYPLVNVENCIDCGLCSKSCPIVDDKYKGLLQNKIQAFALKHKSHEVLNESTSGGAFTAIVQAFADDSTIIFGSSLNENLEAFHTYVIGIDNLSKLRKSKYVESYMGESYSLVKKFLLSGEKVIFSGTPCQVAGLKIFLKKDYEKLLTIDLVCHGVPTGLLLDKYLRYREAKYKSKSKSIEFRSKADSNWTNPKIRVNFENGKIYKQKSFAHDDEYMIGFCNFICLRENCGKCVYAHTSRVSDFTIGDFWGVEHSGLNIDFKDGISLMLANSEHAVLLLEQIKKYVDMYSVNYEYACANNPNLLAPSRADIRRQEFLDDLITMPFEYLQEKYLKPRSKVKNLISNIFSQKAKNVIKKILHMKTYKY